MTVNYRILGIGHWLLVCGLSRLVDPFLSIQNEGSGMPHFTGSLVNQSCAVLGILRTPVPGSAAGPDPARQEKESMEKVRERKFLRGSQNAEPVGRCPQR